MQTKVIQPKETSEQEELLRILTKGMITIPKGWRDTLGLKQGGRIRARKEGGKILLEPLEEKAPYRIYTKKEVNQFLADDSLSPKLRKTIEKKLS